MSTVYETREVTEQREVAAGTRCDGCGAVQRYGYDMVEVVISVHVDEEGGAVDRYDYCNDCLVARASALVAAGSRAYLVTGKESTPEADRG